MSVHSRVAEEKVEEYLEYVSGTYIPRYKSRPRQFLVVKRGKGYRVHEDASPSVSTPTGRQVMVGAMVRRYDPEAGNLEGKPATFDTPEAAAAYIRRWL